MTRNLVILCLALAVVGCAEQKPIPYQHKRCAPGYGLTVNDAGEYWPVRLETGLPLAGYLGEARTKQAAFEPLAGSQSRSKGMLGPGENYAD